MKEEFINKIRRFQTIISTILFIVVFFICWITTNFQLTQIQLSIWGQSGIIGFLWNSIVFLLGLSVFFNSIFWIRGINKLKFRWLSYFLFSLVSLSLLLTGVFNLNWGFLHILFAWIYFFMYPLTIFTHTHLNRKVISYKMWRFGITISVLMMVMPLLTINLVGLAVSEIIHIIFVIIWNIKILNYDKK